jgi:hypothetical protein
MRVGAREYWICTADGMIEVTKVTPEAAPIIANQLNIINLE